MEHTLPIDDLAGIGTEVLDVEKGLIVIYGPDDKTVRRVMNDFFAGLRTSLDDYGSSTFLNFNKDTCLPDTYNLSLLYKMGLLTELEDSVRDAALLRTFIGNVMNPNSENVGKWDHVAPNAPDEFLVAAAQSASLGGKVIISCVAESTQEVIDKFTGAGKQLLQTALAKLIAVSPTREITVTVADANFWNNRD